MTCLAFAISPERELTRVFDTGTELLFLAPRYMSDGTTVRQRQSEGMKRYWGGYRAEKEAASMDANVIVTVPAARDMSQLIFRKHVRLRHPGLRDVTFASHIEDHRDAHGKLDHVHLRSLPDWEDDA